MHADKKMHGLFNLILPKHVEQTFHTTDKKKGNDIADGNAKSLNGVRFLLRFFTSQPPILLKHFFFGVSFLTV
jgi:hypothetical protein